MVIFMMSKIDPSAYGNLLLKMAIIARDKNLVRRLLRIEQVIDARLDDALQYAIGVEDFQIYDLLFQTKLMLDSLDANMSAPAA
jgi:hypothetical protein